jgi:hypothetical protein
MNRKRDWLLGVIILMLAGFMIVAGCGSDRAGHAGGGNDHDHRMTTEGELHETTSGPDELPAFLLNYANRTVDLYGDAHKYMHILQHLNCYCGCMEANDPHDSLFRCFIVDVKEDGSVIWTDHGANCGICMMELQEAVTLAKQGKSVDEIRDAIDAKFKPVGL